MGPYNTTSTKMKYLFSFLVSYAEQFHKGSENCNSTDPVRKAVFQHEHYPLTHCSFLDSTRGATPVHVLGSKGDGNIGYLSVESRGRSGGRLLCSYIPATLFLSRSDDMLRRCREDSKMGKESGGNDCW